MRYRALIPALILVLSSSLAGAEPPHIANPPEPRDGHSELTLRQVWHRGHDDDEFIFGAIRTVEPGPDGNLYVLDTQLSQVFVFAPDGELLRMLSREGDGPGESRRPEDLVFFPDGTLGIAQYINGRIVRIDTEGTPVGTIRPPGVEHGGGGLASIRRVRCRGGSLVINGAQVLTSETGNRRTQYLVRCDDEGAPVQEYVRRTVPMNLMQDGWIERNNYFPSHERWDIDDTGRVLAATERNAYRITVYEPDGTAAFTFGREYEAPRRTAEEKRRMAESLVVIRDGERIAVDTEIEDRDACIAELHVRDTGEIWVLGAGGRKNQPDGVMHTYDVFDPAGVYIRQVSVRCEGDPRQDRLFLLDDGRMALVRGAVQARRNTFGGSGSEEEGIAAHDLKIFAVDGT